MRAETGFLLAAQEKDPRHHRPRLPQTPERQRRAVAPCLIPAYQKRATRIDILCAHSKRLCNLWERKLGQASVVPLPPQILHFRLPEVPVPKHLAHQDTRSSEPHFGHRSRSRDELFIACHSLASPSYQLPQGIHQRM
jgi:hypothetical protein